MYESSIAYGMRKALQAEQSKAEMMIKIQDIEHECGNLEDECEALKVKINRMLDENMRDKEQSRENHEAESNAMYEVNQNTAAELKKWLFTFSENVEEADNA